MENKIKKAFVFDIAGAAALIAAMIYFLIFACVIFPQYALSDAGQTSENIVQAFGVALGSAIAVAVLITIFVIICAVGLVVGVFLIVSACKRKKYLLKNDFAANRKKFNVFLTVGLVADFVVTAFCVYLAFSPFLHYLPVAVVCCASLVLTGVGFYLSRNAARENV